MRTALLALVVVGLVVSAVGQADVAKGWRVDGTTKEQAAAQAQHAGTVASSSMVPGNANLLNLWFKDYLTTFGKNYSTPQAQQAALRNFMASLINIQKVNNDMSVPYWLSPNQFSDMDINQLKNTMLPDKGVLGVPTPSAQRRRLHEEAAARPVEHTAEPSRKLLAATRVVDWRNYVPLTATSPPKGRYVSDPKDQGWCGSCVTFATVGAMEAAYHISRRLPIGNTATNFARDLSEQQLLRCQKTKAGLWSNFAAYGCGGASILGAMLYATSNGVAAEVQYPYSKDYTNWKLAPTGTNPDPRPEACQIAKVPLNGKYIKNAWTMPANQQWITNEAALMAMVDQQPVVIGFAVVDNNFFNYRSGIYTRALSANDWQYVNHAMLLVGYVYNPANPPSKNYWIIKNSWGTGWGQGGYINVAFGGQETLGVCGMYQMAVAPGLNFKFTY